MRNLKRVLSLALAVMMLIGMMVVGANAAGYNDFTDKDEIENKDAVSMLVSLGIINGMEDGSYFAPTQGVDRAQMAKMISVIMNLGIDKGDLYENTPTGLTDISNSWAKGHINFCYTTGIIAGRGNNTFDPNTGVTGTEAAKMLLVAAGYDPAVEGLTGAQWQTKTIALASKLGIFRNYTKPVTDKLSRDDAALLIYNALDIEMIQKYEDGYALSYADHRTILSAMYGVYKVEGVVTANEWAILDDDSDTALKTGLTTIYNADGIFSTTTSTSVNDKDSNVKTATFEVSTPVDMLGKTVVMYVKKATILENSTVYGDAIVASSNNVIETGVRVTGGTTKDDDSLASLLKGTGLSVDKYTEYYHNYEEVAIDNTDTSDVMNVRGAALTVIDNDNDGYVDYVLSLQKDLTYVSAVSTKNDTTTLYGLPGDDVVDNDEIVTSEDLAKDDVVLVVQYGGRTYVEYPKTVTGEMELFNATSKDPSKNYIKVEGEKYNEDELKVLSVSNKNTIKFVLTDCATATGVQFDATYDFFLDDFGNILAYREVEGAPTQYALALDSAYSINGLTTTGQIKLLLADGTSKIYDVDMDATASKFEAMADDNDGDTAIEKWFKSSINDDNAMDAVLKFMGSDDISQVGKGDRGYAAGNLVAYTIDEDTQEVTFQPAGLDLGTWVNGTSTTYNVNGFFAPQQPKTTAILGADLEKGDVDLIYTYGGNYATDHRGSYGIDEDTVVYYYNGSKANVVKGYSAMANLIPKAGSGSGIDQVNTKVSVVAFDDATDVAEVIVVYTTKASFGSEDYLFLMKTYNKSGSIYTYTAIDEEGNVFEIQSKDGSSVANRYAGALVTYSKDGDLYKLTPVTDKYYAGQPAPTSTDTGADLGMIVVDRTDYVKVYDFSTAADLDANDPEAVNQTALLDNYWVRYADKALVIDVDNTDYDADTAAETEFTSGQYGWVVFDESKKAVVAFITDTYKMEADVTPGGNNDGRDLLASVVVNDATQYVPSAGYSTIAKAVENAETIKMNSDSSQKYKIALTAKNLGNGECWGNAGLFGSKTAALTGNVTQGNNALSGTTQNWANAGVTIAEGNYIVIEVNNNLVSTYYAYTFVK
ncbi:S-layer homology domain-containing protein [uncultured Flavonifractor sp.]|uniref:S-layer homology domain-containing protein n=1 Tax=uncultured Flavonifractor sp. TaxID=1193534 RepID=UPI0026354260|nr:S-layer homology domain-containing protein [uncultured Flavonifractor sp.]